MNLQGVPPDSVIHLALQLWQEPWQRGMENEDSDIR